MSRDSNDTRSGAVHLSADRALRPVVFLDIDDVLCLSNPYGGYDAIAAVNGRHLNPESVYRELFASNAVRALKRMHERMDARVQYVISSTWRESFARHDLVAVFRRAGLGFVAERLVAGDAWRTPPKFQRSQRVHEIAQWLDQHHRGEPFVIVDDTHSGASLMLAHAATDTAAHPFAGRVVLCQERVGLTDAHVQPVLDALRREVISPSTKKEPS